MTSLSRTMILHLFLVTMIVASAVFGRSMDELREDDVDSQTIDDQEIEDRFVEVTSKSGPAMYGIFTNYSSSQGKLTDDTLFVKSFPDRITGGTNAKKGEIPWQASVKISKGGYYFNHCGAVIIDKFWLLSAAHCFENPIQYWVTVGEYDTRYQDEGQQMFKVDQIYTHKGYNDVTKDCDIALLRIQPQRNSNGIIFGRFVKQISLPDYKTILRKGVSLIVSGWGGLLECKNCNEEPQNYPAILQKVEVPYVDQETCRRLLIPYTVTNNMFCAGHLDGRADSCPGDSGGPITYRNAGSHVLVGIVSWGDGCGLPNKPGVYTKVSPFMGWIRQTMKSAV